MKKIKPFMITLVFVLALTVSALAQSVLHLRISTSFSGIVLTDLLSYLHKAYDIDFYYSGNIPLDKRISIVSADLPLVVFLERLCLKAGLAYRIIDNRVVLKKDGPDVKAVPEIHQLSAAITVHQLPPVTKKPVQPVEKLNPVLGAVRPAEQRFSLPDIRRQELVMATGSAGNGRPGRKAHNLSVGLIIFHDRFNFDFKKPANRDHEYRSGESHGVGVWATFRPAASIGVSLGVLLSRKIYFLNYTFKVIDPGDPVALPDNTMVGVSYLEFPTRLRFRVFEVKKFSLSLSSGLTMGFLAGKKENTLLRNGKQEKTTYFAGDNTRFLWGCLLGTRVWYTLYERVKVYLGADYIHYFTPVNKAIMHAGNPALRTSIGVSLNM